MKVQYELEVRESCSECSYTKAGFFCGFSKEVLKSLDRASHVSALPAGAILFVEGQIARGIFILCSGRVKLSTSSKEGKILVLKTAEAGDALGLSAAIAGENYEMTAETATACQLNSVDRRSLLNLLQSHSEVGVHAAQSPSGIFRPLIAIFTTCCCRGHQLGNLRDCCCRARQSKFPARWRSACSP